jgi:hypothetical protein
VNVICAEFYRLGLGLSYIQRRQFSGNTPALPNQLAHKPNRMAFPTTKAAKHPAHSAVNIRTSELELSFAKTPQGLDSGSRNNVTGLCLAKLYAQ